MQPEVSDTPLLHWALETLLQHLTLTTPGSTWSEVEIGAIVVAACAQGTSIEDICAQLEEGPPARIVRYQLGRSILREPEEGSALDALEEAAQALLTAYWSPQLTARPRDLAVDFTLVPYQRLKEEKCIPWGRNGSSDRCMRESARPVLPVTFSSAKASVKPQGKGRG